MPQNLDIELLRSFVAIAPLQSLSRAAERIGRTQSALSIQMKRLEEVSGQTLFRRTSKGMSLTAQGENMLVYAQRILQLHDEALAQMNGQGLSGHIRFGCPEDYATVFLPKMLQEFALLHPKAQIEVHCAATPILRKMLKNQSIDLTITSVFPDMPNTHHTPVLRYEPLVWVGGNNEHLLHQEVLPLALSHAQSLDYQDTCNALQAMQRAYRVAYASSSLAGLFAMVRSGQALAVVTTTAVVPPDLKILLPDGILLPHLSQVGLILETAPHANSNLIEAFALHVKQILTHF